MVVPEELELEAELKCDTATALEEEALRLHGKGWRIQSMGKLREAESLRDEAEGLKQRARLLCQQYKGMKEHVMMRICIHRACQAWPPTCSINDLLACTSVLVSYHEAWHK